MMFDEIPRRDLVGAYLAPCAKGNARRGQVVALGPRRAEVRRGPPRSYLGKQNLGEI
jgi:hypothetical protein